MREETGPSQPIDITNPQSWNRYAYVLNNPLGLIDPLGLECLTIGGGTWSVSAGGETDSGTDPVSVVCDNDTFQSNIGGGGELLMLQNLPTAPNNGPNPQQPQPPEPEPKPGWCTALNHAGNTTVALGGVVFLWGTLADAGVVTAPAGIISQASGGIGMAVGGIGIGVADAGMALGICH